MHRSSLTALVLTICAVVGTVTGCGSQLTSDEATLRPLPTEGTQSAAPSPSPRTQAPSPKPGDSTSSVTLAEVTIDESGAVSFAPATLTGASDIDDATTVLVSTLAPSATDAQDDPYPAAVSYIVRAPAGTRCSSVGGGAWVFERGDDPLLALAEDGTVDQPIAPKILGDAGDWSQDEIRLHLRDWDCEELADQSDDAAGSAFSLTAPVRPPTNAPQSQTADTGLSVVTVWGTATIANATWVRRENHQQSLRVEPTAFGRLAATAPYGWAMREIVQIEPAANTAVMDKQLRCHLIGARDKAHWYLEPWRPDVPLTSYMVARCNPDPSP